MPELPEIETMRRAIRPGVMGRRITAVEVRQPKVVADLDATEFENRLLGRTFTDLTRRGKAIVAWMDDGQRMVMRMGMTGCVVIAPRDHPEDRHTHIVVSLDDGDELRFSDMRRFGRFWLFRADDEDTSGIRELGPEPDDPTLTAEYLEKRLGGCHRAIKTCLLDQSVVAGIGNIYSDEILFNCGIDPSCQACRLDRADWERLADEIPRCIGFFVENNEMSPGEWLENNEMSPGEWLESMGREYRNTPYIRIYGHAGEPCPKCGETLVRSVIGGRSSVHCPMCQMR